MNFNDYYEIIRKNIRRYRKLEKLSQEDLANLSNISKTTISSLESNNFKKHLSLETYCLIAETLGINIIDLLEPDFDSKFSNSLPTFNRKKDFLKNFNYENYYNIIVDNIINWRHAKDLSQEQLAEKANISYKFLSKIESKKKNFTLKTLGKIADALKIDIRLLFNSLE